MSCGGDTRYGLCEVTPMAWGASTNPLGCCPVPVPRRHFFVGGAGFTPDGPHLLPHFQRTVALHCAPCNVFPAGPGRVRPSASSSGRCQSRRQARATTRVPGLSAGRRPYETGTSTCILNASLCL
ncbi:hypothetical protein NDU88_008992 [Pleurodeles waltl]|uniref:Uncharacterized protein n=1 Tax=Pleurodeles waltl TaxID=8319 RepID=A0AAV7RZ77_PLEWA|nr:hypothetical protein NDU88_008992 [Pleurodeles waltl]